MEYFSIFSTKNRRKSEQIFVISHNNIIFLVGTVACLGYTFTFNVPHLIISGSIASSPFSISWMFPLSRCANGSSSFSLSQSLNIHILLYSVSADRNTGCDRYAVCKKRKLPPMGNHGAAASFVISHFLQSFIYAQVCLKPTQINIFI